MKEIILIKQLNEPIKKDIINLLKKFGLSTCKKINFITLFSWDIAKILHSCCFEYFRYTWPRPTLMFIYTKNQLRPSILSWDISKILQSFSFWVLWVWLTMPSKTDGINLCESLIFICAQKRTSHSLFLRYCKDIADLLLRVLWRCLAMTTKDNGISLHRAKNQIHSSSLSWNIADFTNLFFLLCWACLSTSTKNNMVNL